MQPDNCHALSCQHQVFKKELHAVIGQEIRILRKSKGITGHELGSIIQLSQQQISRYENGDSAIPLDTLILILRIFNISPEKFIHRVLMNPLMILVKIIKLRWIHILSYDQMVSRKINNQTTRCANSIF
ncbi:helix-turn-helix domain-containing protein, partial [Morganella morganii]|uniref:helix-turn-helix domain-containing protein n=1 Tax=Morganella morganii TaxID=582 RepID=UPI00197B7B28